MKQKINRIRRRSGIVGILLLLILIMYVWIGFPKENRITAFDNEEVRYLQGSVYVSCNGEEIKTVLPDLRIVQHLKVPSGRSGMREEIRSRRKKRILFPGLL